MGPVVGNIPAGSVPALWVLNRVQHSAHEDHKPQCFFSIREPLNCKITFNERCISLSWILAILNNQYCYSCGMNSYLSVMVIAQGKVKQHKAGSNICGQRKGVAHNYVLKTCPLSVTYLSAIMVWYHSRL